MVVAWDAASFKIVTGISAGALVAPFAYLGPQYDDIILRICSAIGPKDIFHSRNVLTRLASDGIADSKPLSRLVAQYITADILAAIAAQYANGRLLMIGTTDLDAGRPVTWNMGAIAASGRAGSARPVSQDPDRVDEYSRRRFTRHDRRGGQRPTVPGNARGRRRHHAGISLPPGTVMALNNVTGRVCAVIGIST